MRTSLEIAAKEIPPGQPMPPIGDASIRLHNAPMIPKPLQFALLLPLAFGWMAPGLFLALFGLGLLGVALWWMHSVLSSLLGD